MTNGQDQGQPYDPWQPQQYDPATYQRRLQGPPQEPPWQQPAYQQQGYGQQYPQDEPWPPQQYDPYAHQQRIGSQQYPPQAPPRQHPGYGQPPFPPQQPGYQPGLPPPRKSWPARHKVLTGLIAFASLIVIGGIANAAGGSKQANTAANTPTVTTAASPAVTAHPSSAGRSKSSAKSKATDKAATACDNRPWASGDIYVRMISPGTQWVAQELGGEWSWNYALGKCLTSVQLMMATAPMTAGNCTQVGYVADNPGYDPNANVAAPLKQLAAQVGPAC
jgi:hypothetical protein